VLQVLFYMLARCGQPFVILNLFRDNAPPSPVILKQVQDDDSFGVRDADSFVSGMTICRMGLADSFAPRTP
jgi:hypothetical protein